MMIIERVEILSLIYSVNKILCVLFHKQIFPQEFASWTLCHVMSPGSFCFREPECRTLNGRLWGKFESIITNSLGRLIEPTISTRCINLHHNKSHKFQVQHYHSGFHSIFQIWNRAAFKQQNLVLIAIFAHLTWHSNFYNSFSLD